MKKLIITLAIIMVFAVGVWAEEQEETDQRHTENIFSFSMTEISKLAQEIQQEMQAEIESKCHWEVKVYALYHGQEKLLKGWEIHDIIDNSFELIPYQCGFPPSL